MLSTFRATDVHMMLLLRSHFDQLVNLRVMVNVFEDFEINLTEITMLKHVVKRHNCTHQT